MSSKWCDTVSFFLRFQKSLIGFSSSRGIGFSLNVLVCFQFSIKRAFNYLKFNLMDITVVTFAYPSVHGETTLNLVFHFLIMIRQCESSGWHSSSVPHRIFSYSACNSFPCCRQTLLQPLFLQGTLTRVALVAIR